MDSIKCASQFVEAYNSGGWDRLKESFTADAVYDEVGTRRRLQGPDEILRANQGWKQAFPDSKGSITGAFADDGDVMLEITWEGTHTGPLESPQGLSPPARDSLARSTMTSIGTEAHALVHSGRSERVGGRRSRSCSGRT